MKASALRTIKRQRTLRLAKLLSRAFYLRNRNRQTEMYNLICNEMVSLGGVYVKFLQGVLLGSKAMRKWSDPNRLKIFESLDTEPLDIVQLLRAELSPQLLKNITMVQPEPFAAGSFGQVYFGQHQNGKQIIIKILRPQIRELLRYDLRLLGVFAKRFAAGEYKNISLNMEQALKEFRQATLRETDYIAEANFARELFEAYRNHPTLVIPETYLDLSTPHMIVQDYVSGISAVDLLKIKERGEDPVAYVAEHLGSDLDTQLITFGVESLRGAFNLPRVQGDPHPGNIRFLPDNKVGMIDFGISAPAPENESAFFGVLNEWSLIYERGNNISNLFEQLMRYFMNDLYRALVKASTMRSVQEIHQARQRSSGHPTKEEFNFSKELGRMMQEMLHSSLGTDDLRTILDDGRMLQIFNNIINKNNRFGLVVQLESSEILRAAQTYMTMVEALGRRREVMPRVFSDVVRIVDAEHPDIRSEDEDPVSTTQALAIINRWLERVAARDPALFEKLLRRIKLHSPVPLDKTIDAGAETLNA